MTMSKLPYTIKTIFDQIGISMMRVGGHKAGYNLTNAKYSPEELQECSCYPEEYSSVRKDGQVLQGVGVYFRVNTKRKIYLYVSYEPDDTYTLRLWKAHTPLEYVKYQTIGKVLDEQTEIFCDILGDVIERMYEKYIREYQNGFIHI